MKKSILIAVLTLVFQCYATKVAAQSKLVSQSEELGQVNWYRDYDKAVAAAKKEFKDILILFQEVPGCATCRNYGNNVLSHPLMVEAIENEFIPLAIFNNKGGKDKEILDKFNEPSWNNPAVRIIDTKGRNVVKRIYGDYSSRALYNGMAEALASTGKKLPGYFELLGQELTANGRTKEKHFQMYCFWSGEKNLGKIDGVIDTEAGFMNHAEVVKVTYNPAVVSESALESFAAKNSIKPVDTDDSYRQAKNDIHYYLRHTDFKYLPLSTLQQTKINSALGSGKSGISYLSPKQKKWFDDISRASKKGKPLLTVDFENAWASLEKDMMTRPSK